MKHLLSLVTFFVITQSIFSQTFQVTGTIVEESGIGLPTVVVSLRSPTDSSLVAKSVTDFNGSFAMQTNAGKYIIEASFVSYKKYTKAIEITSRNLKLDTIILQEDVQTLDEVKIEAEKSTMSLQLDKRVFNVSENATSSGGSATEVLETIPSVQVDVEGNVSLRGSENVRILVDGKPSSLVGNDQSGLNQIPANMIEKVEVITNPSARYDAQGDVGIINIVLKKQEQRGFNGSFESMIGWPNNHRISLNMNYRSKKMNVFTSYGLFYNERPGFGNSQQEFKGDSSFYYETDAEHVRGGLGHNLQFGTDIYLNDRNTLTLTGLYKQSEGDNYSYTTYSDYDINRILSSESYRRDDEVEGKRAFEGSIDYRKTFKQEGRKLTAQLKAFESDDDENSIIKQTYSLYPDSTLLQTSDNTEDELNYLGQIDYIHPIGKHGKFESGLKSSFRFIENNFLVQQQDGNGGYTDLSDFNNDFNYDEIIHAAYVQYGNKWKDISYQGGLRAEYTDLTTTLKLTNEKNNRTYANLFPSVFLSKELDSISTMQLSYSRRIGRPRFRHLLPFYGYRDNRNIFAGNPDLNPVFTNSFELGYLRYLKNGSFLPTIFYRHSTGVINRITISDSLGITQTLPVNLSTEHAVGLELSGNYDFKKKLRTNANVNIFYSHAEGSYEELTLKQESFMMMGRVTAKYPINKTTDFQLTGMYFSPRRTAQGYNKSMSSLDLAISKEVLNKKGKLVFAVRDLFNSRRHRGIVDTEEYYLESDHLRRTRMLTLSFNYQLKPTKHKKGKDRGGADNFGDDEF